MSGVLRSVSDPIDILDHLRGADRLIMIDACRSGGQPGTMIRLDGFDQCIEGGRGQSTHGISLIHALRLAHTLGRLPQQVILYCVEVSQCQPQTDVGPLLRKAIPAMARRISDELSTKA